MFSKFESVFVKLKDAWHKFKFGGKIYDTRSRLWIIKPYPNAACASPLRLGGFQSEGEFLDSPLERGVFRLSDAKSEDGVWENKYLALLKIFFATVFNPVPASVLGNFKIFWNYKYNW